LITSSIAVKRRKTKETRQQKLLCYLLVFIFCTALNEKFNERQKENPRQISLTGAGVRGD
jgi:hypothetical protein